MTYAEIFELFLKKNPMLKLAVNDYRPDGVMKLIIWLKTGVNITVYYNEKTSDFEICELGIS